MSSLTGFVSGQLSAWPLADDNFRRIPSSRVRRFKVGGLEVILQANPCRIASSTARVDAASIAARPCFLCVDNRPPEQYHVPFRAAGGQGYNIQVNPFPIFPEHLVIASEVHRPQTCHGTYPDALSFTLAYPEFTVFYNGPHCGASAPDHLHFQACPNGLLPLANAADSFCTRPDAPVLTAGKACLYKLPVFCRGIFLLCSTDAGDMDGLFRKLISSADVADGEYEPGLSFYVWRFGSEYRTVVLFRSAFRSHHYFSEGPDHLTMSPGAADMAGFFVSPRMEDFTKMTASLLEEMVAEVSLDEDRESALIRRLQRTQATLDVGIMSAPEIGFEFPYDGKGRRSVRVSDGRISYEGKQYDELEFPVPVFILHSVTIGIDFHWQQKRKLRYPGTLRFVVSGGNVIAVNRIGVEDYLQCVISSEMKASAPLELLKAHAVISRSWVMTNLGTHGIFDVCADDHCQRYQGLTMAVGDMVRAAIDQTWGVLLRYGDGICDARYSKCCGGRTELFSTCWEDVDPPYLLSFPDAPEAGGEPFCDCDDEEILSTVLNDYDLKTRDFFRWRVRYSREELSELVRRRSGIDFGLIENLEVVERGPSGRIKFLRIIGALRSEVIGKELKIRKVLSESHLKSSAFEISREGSAFILDGHGWGHGVGLCQIGAAVMSTRGYGWIDILKHYYPGAEIR